MDSSPSLLPVGVRRLRDADDAAEVPIYRGVSYCDAVQRAVRRAGAEGGALRVLSGSIKVCHWSPVVLGLKQPEDAFERSLAPCLPYRAAGLLLGPLDGFAGEPEVVIVRAAPGHLRARAAAAGPSNLWRGHAGQIDCSALPVLAGSAGGSRPVLIGAVNRLLAALAPSATWQALTRRLFRSRAITIGFEALISRALADMSICRNSTVIPLLSGRANVSFFCTGAITWGLHPANYLTSGWPWPIYRRSEPPAHLPARGSP